MTQTVLVLGANGRFGRAAIEAFAAEGWDVRAATRNGEGGGQARITPVACDVMDRAAVTQAAKGADVIVHAVNPPYHKWADLMPTLTANIIAAGLDSGATVMIPGNVYTFGAQSDVVLRENALPAPTSRKGALRVEMEHAFKVAAEQGLRTIILRGGDFLERTQTGSWFDSIIAKKVHKGQFTYPGAMDAVHAWAYLPDMARAMVNLASERETFGPFTAFGFEGYSLTGGELMAASAGAVGQPLVAKKVPWTLLRLLGVAMPMVRELHEMRYLWDTPHRIDGAPLRVALPAFSPTPLAVAMKDVLRSQGATGLTS